MGPPSTTVLGPGLLGTNKCVSHSFTHTLPWPSVIVRRKDILVLVTVNWEYLNPLAGKCPEETQRTEDRGTKMRALMIYRSFDNAIFDWLAAPYDPGYFVFRI